MSSGYRITPIVYIVGLGHFREFCKAEESEQEGSSYNGKEAR